MSLNIADLALNQRTFTMSYRINDELSRDITMTYTPNGYSPAVEEKLRNAQGEPLRQADIAAEMLANMLIAWDVVDLARDEAGNPIARTDAKGRPVTGPDGEPEYETVPFPTTKAGLARLGSPFLQACLGALVDDLRVDRTAVKN